MSILVSSHSDYATSDEQVSATPDYVKAVIRNLSSSDNVVLYYALKCTPAARYHRGWYKKEKSPFPDAELQDKLEEIATHHSHEGARYLALLSGEITQTDAFLIPLLNDPSAVVKNAGLRRLGRGNRPGRAPAEEQTEANEKDFARAREDYRRKQFATSPKGRSAVRQA